MRHVRTASAVNYTPDFDELAAWCDQHWGLKLHRAKGVESDHSLRPYVRGFVLIGSAPGHRHRTRWFPSLRRVAEVTEFEQKGSGNEGKGIRS